MRKADLVNSIAQKTGVPKVDVLFTIEHFLKEIKENMTNGRNVYIRGFGSFVVKKRAAKVGRNIRKNEAVNIPEHFIPSFKPSKDFTILLKDLKESDLSED